MIFKKFFAKPETKHKKRNHRPRLGKSNKKEKESLKVKIVRVARDSKDVEDLRLRLAAMLNEEKPLEFGNPEVKLIENKDPLDQMIEKNIFPPLDEWRCPICDERVDI
jgi:hypothetical protein